MFQLLRGVVVSLSKSHRVYTMLPVCSCRRFAGHSHWQNVKHTKEANDKVRSRKAEVVMRAVRSAVQAYGGVKDPNQNEQLAAAIESARNNNVPYATIKRYLAEDTYTDPYVVGVAAPGGMFIIVESTNVKVIQEKSNMQSIAKRFGFKVMDEKRLISVMQEYFMHRAVIKLLPSSNPSLSDEDAVTELALAVGGEDVELQTEDGDVAYCIICEPMLLKQIEGKLRGLQAVIYDSYDEYVPQSFAEVTKEDYDKIEGMYAKIHSNCSNVTRIFSNIRTAT